MTERLAQDLPILALMAAFVVGYFLVFDIFARFTYSLSEQGLVMRVHVLRWVPVARRTIRFRDIREVRGGYHPTWFPVRSVVFGHIFKKGVITIVLRRRVALVTRYCITPDEPGRFLAALRRRMAEAA